MVIRFLQQVAVEFSSIVQHNIRLHHQLLFEARGDTIISAFCSFQTLYFFFGIREKHSHEWIGGHGPVFIITNSCEEITIITVSPSHILSWELSIGSPHIQKYGVEAS